jgi:hypothetical protein
MLLTALIWFLVITCGFAFLLWAVVIGLFLFEALTLLVRTIRSPA